MRYLASAAAQSGCSRRSLWPLKWKSPISGTPAPTGTGIMPGPESVCSERVRREPERRRRNSARKRSGTRTADGGALELPRGFWRAVGPRSGPPTEGERRQPRLISQVTGQKGGRRGATGPGRLPLFVVFGRRQAVGRRTALFKLHQELGARMVDFEIGRHTSELQSRGHLVC